jgi:hypothetical protein
VLTYPWRIVCALLLVSLWMTLIFTGWVFYGLTHILLAAAVILFPWKSLPRETDGEAPSPQGDRGGAG